MGLYRKTKTQKIGSIVETYGDRESKTSPTQVHYGFPYGLKTAKFNLESGQ